MRVVIGIIFSLFLTILGITFLVLFIRTYQMQHNDSSRIFASGIVPEKLLDGYYKGRFRDTPWLGKKFDAKNGKGINVFEKEEAFTFKLSKGKGVADPELEVIKIDYSVNEKPWWLRFILDEAVEIKPGHLLGKIHLTIIPGFPFTIGYFELIR